MSRTVLIVDDSKTERVVLNGFLKSEYAVLEAASGEEAIALLLHILQNAIRLRETAEIMNALWRDSLTGLLNRESFFTEAERMIKRHEKGYFLLTSFDVENFKVINDQYGTALGDEVLKHISGCLKRFAAENDGLACRYAADTFSLLCPARLRDSDAQQSCYEEMIRPGCVNRPIRIRMGSYLISDRELSVSAICDRASMAERSVKGRFDAHSAEYTEAMRDELLHEQQIVNDMVSALKNGEFEPWFQPLTFLAIPRSRRRRFTWM